MGSFNLKHSMWFFFSYFVQYFVSWQGELGTDCCLHAEYTHSFEAFLHYTQRGVDWKRKRLVQIQCTTTSWEMDTHFSMLEFICTTHPWDSDGLQKQNPPLRKVELASLSVLSLQQQPDTEDKMSLQAQEKINACQRDTGNWPPDIDRGKYMRDAWHALVMAQTRSFGKYTHPSDDLTWTNNWVKMGLFPSKLERRIQVTYVCR